MKKFLTVLFVLVLFVFTALQSFANGGCGYEKGKHKEGHHSDSLDKKFYENIYFIILHTDELNITDEQYGQIKDLKYQVKKDIIKKQAEIEVIKIDIKRELWEDTIDTAKINELIDQKYTLKKEKAKYLVAAYANLKSILSDDQKSKMKDIQIEYKKENKYGK